MAEPDTNALRRLPAVATVLATQGAALLLDRHGRTAATEAIRHVIDDARTALRTVPGSPPDADEVAIRAGNLLDARAPGLRPVFNLTGTVLHTNLGRAVLADSAVEAAIASMRHPVALEYDLATGSRGERDD